MKAAQSAKAASILSKQVRIRGTVTTWREWVESARHEVGTSDGTSLDYNRRHFNRLDHAGQRDYMARLAAKRYYWVGGVMVPKTVFDYALAHYGI